MARQGVGRRGLEDPVGQRPQMRVDVARAASPACESAVTAPSSTVGVAQQEPERSHPRRTRSPRRLLRRPCCMTIHIMHTPANGRGYVRCDRPLAVAGRRHGGVAELVDLLGREGPVGGAEGQPVGQRGPPVADLLARIRVEQRDLLEEVAGAGPQRALDLRRPSRVGDDERHVGQGGRVGGDLVVSRRRLAGASQLVDVELQRDGPRREAEGGERLRVQLAGVADEGAVGEGDARAATGVPRRVVGSPVRPPPARRPLAPRRAPTRRRPPTRPPVRAPTSRSAPPRRP